MAMQSAKRVHSVHSFYGYLEDVTGSLGDVRAAMKNGRVSKAFRERIMLAVTQVNGCRYCSYYHTKLALETGMKPEEIAALLNGDLGDVPLEELVAILFAQHYAESQADPDPASRQQLVETYGAETSRDILALIRMIMIGNIYGNSFDALQQRLRGRPVSGSTLTREFGIVIGPLFYMPLIAAHEIVENVRNRR